MILRSGTDVHRAASVLASELASKSSHQQDWSNRQLCIHVQRRQQGPWRRCPESVQAEDQGERRRHPPSAITPDSLFTDAYDKFLKDRAALLAQSGRKLADV